MNYAVAVALLLLVGLLTLVSYVDRVYQEVGKFAFPRIPGQHRRI